MTQIRYPFGILLFWAFGCISLSAQRTNHYDLRLTVTQLFDSIINNSRDTLVIENIVVIADQDPNSRFPIYYKNNPSRWLPIIEQSDSIIIDKQVGLINVKFENPLVFGKIRFRGLYYEFVESFSDQLWYQCSFQSFVGNSLEAYSYTFRECHFGRYMKIENMDVAFSLIEKCQFTGNHIMINRGDFSLLYKENTFARNVTIYLNGNIDIEFYNNIYKGNSHQVQFENTSIVSSMLIEADTFYSPLIFNNMSIKDGLTIDKTHFGSGVVLNGLNFPPFNTSARWPQFEGNRLVSIQDDTIRIHAGNAHLHEESGYFNLLKSYSQLQHAYQNNGDRSSFNACYVEMRNMETKQSIQHFKSKPSFTSFFEMGLNQFLKWFCNYGTSPVKAMLFSFMVIMFFAILYFLFPSEEGRVHVRPLLAKIRDRNVAKSIYRKDIDHLGIQIADAIATSMNAFVTLGYGKMPVKGLSKYLAVLEGLIGWFLLSIFSVSLISQILQ